MHTKKPENTELLAQALVFAASGKKSAAVDLLTRYVSSNPQDSAASSALDQLKASPAAATTPATQREIPLSPLPGSPRPMGMDDLDYIQQQDPARAEPLSWKFSDPHSLNTDTSDENHPEYRPIFPVPIECSGATLPDCTDGKEPEAQSITDAAKAPAKNNARLLPTKDELGSAPVKDPHGPPEKPEWDNIPAPNSPEHKPVTANKPKPGHALPLSVAERCAADIAVKVGWSRFETPILVDILEHHNSHWKTKNSLEEMISNQDATPEELAVCHEIRLHWETGGYNRIYRYEEAREGWPNCQWGLALRIIRETGIDDADALMAFVDDCFEDWVNTPGLIKIHLFFQSYLDRVLDKMADLRIGNAPVMPAYIDYSLFQDASDCYDSWHKSRPKFNHGYSILETMYG
ncbi:MAG TPA: hypothetical protein VK036_08015 [Wenzhouxiangella sp.]|nr:hypothetical protein [Wenzhouxiangella sp.]